MQEIGVRMRGATIEGVMLKKTIEGLINRDFLERDENDRNFYVYLEWIITK